MIDPDQVAYWDKRHVSNQGPGEGSLGAQAVWKGEYVSATLKEHGITSVIDWGCGAGHQLAYYQLDGIDYVGTDISIEAILQSRMKFPNQYFIHRPKLRVDRVAEASLSMDVLFHQVTDEMFVSHLDDIFGRATRLVIVFSSNYESGQTAVHVKHRWFTPVVKIRFPEWMLIDGGYGREVRDFYVYEKRA